MASPFSTMLIFFKESGGRAMYWERASRVLADPAGMRTEASTLTRTGQQEHKYCTAARALNQEAYERKNRERGRYEMDRKAIK